MKSILFAIFGLISFCGFSQQETLSKVIKGLEMGQVGQIQDHLMTEVDFTLSDFEDFCSKSQVTTKLKEFFNSHSPKSFSMKHMGESASDELYRIGDLSTSNGTYRVTIFLEKSGSTYKVSQLKIE